MNHPDNSGVGMENPNDRPGFSDRDGFSATIPAPPTGNNEPFDEEEIIRQARSAASRKISQLRPDELMEKKEQIFSTSEAAEFFDRSSQWIYWGLREEIFHDENGVPVQPTRKGQGRGQRCFTVPILRSIMISAYERGSFSPEHLRIINRRIKYAEIGVDWREREGWHYAHLGRNRYRWVPPGECEWDAHAKKWVPNENFDRRRSAQADA